MKYKGIDYTNRTPKQNLDVLFEAVCIELVQSNKSLLDAALRITEKHLEIMQIELKETDKNRHFLHKLEPTIKEMNLILKEK